MYRRKVGKCMYNPYAILGVSPNSSLEDIKSSYKYLSKIYHPDNIETGNVKRFKEIKEAWEYISKNGSQLPKSINSHKKTFTHVTLFHIKEVI